VIARNTVQGLQGLVTQTLVLAWPHLSFCEVQPPSLGCPLIEWACLGCWEFFESTKTSSPATH
jgi:hypothetical protein